VPAAGARRIGIARRDLGSLPDGRRQAALPPPRAARKSEGRGVAAGCTLQTTTDLRAGEQALAGGGKVTTFAADHKEPS
jgi:hypothetical protein